MRRRILGIAAAATLVWSALPAGGAAATAGAAFTATSTITRDHLLNGVTTTVDSRTVSLSVAQTQNLRGFQRIDVSWNGAHPTGGTVPDVNDGTQGIFLEYPMVLLECRGVDSASVPPDQQLDPTTCWTAYEPDERTATELVGGPNVGFPPFRLDMYATPDQRKAVVGVPPGALNGCPGPGVQHWVPLRTADGTTYFPGRGCNGQYPVPPEAQNPGGGDTLSFPSNETYASTAADGSGRASFDVLTANENASLGCSDTVACALVAVPVMGIGCDVAAAGLPPEDQPPTSTAAQVEAECTKSGILTPGHPGGQGGDHAVQGRLWWAASNWRNRITVPLGFAPVADPCRVTGLGKAEVDIYGAESMAEATAQWDPHFCSDPSLFTLKHVQAPEPVARNVLAKGLVSAAFSSYAPAGTYSAAVVKAPVALTGFAISFSVDDKAGREVTNLRLNARLLAKLLTENYPTTPEVQRAYLQSNPVNILADPEFMALNPQVSGGPGGIDIRTQLNTYSAGTLYALASDSDAIYALTSYIINDPEARAWLNGAPDPWGMVVNPNYNLTRTSDITLPTNSWRLLDTHKINPPSVGPDGRPTTCDFSGSPYLGLIASPVAQMVKIAQAVEFAWPLSAVGCKDLPDPFINGAYSHQPARLARSVTGAAPGTRFVLGLTSLGEAGRYGLNTASLQSQPAAGTVAGQVAGAVAGQFTPPDQRTFVAPNDASLRAAAALLAPDPDTQTWQIPHASAASPAGAGAYPGTMLVDAQIPTSGLSPADAGNLAKFLRFAAGSGQQPGTGVGQLPAGYLPMTAANGMGALVAYTNAAADAVAAQSGTVPPVVPGSASQSPPAPGGSRSSSSSPTGSFNTRPTSTASTTTATAAVTGTTTTADAGSSGPGGEFAAIGGSLGGRTGSGPQAIPPVAAPRTGIAGVLGTTIAILSKAGSLLRWLIYVALAALVGAGLVYYVAARGLGSKPSLKGMKETLRGLFARRRAPR